MIDREKAIKGLECCIPMTLRNGLGDCGNCPYDREITIDSELTECCHDLMTDALALLKAQEPIEARLHLCESCTKEYPECDATIDGIEFGCGVGNDNIIGCMAYVNRWKAQEPVEPKKNDVELAGLRTWDWACPECNCILIYRANYCSCCGRAVKWE